MDNIAIAVSIISILIAISSFAYAFELKEELNNNINNLNLKFNSMNSKIMSLNNTIYKNSNKINKNSEKINNLDERFNSTIVSQQGEIKSLTSDLEKFNAELSDKLSWISEDASVANFSEYSNERSLLNKCVGSEINLGCVWYVIHDKIGIKYIGDTEFNTTDTLFNLSEIYHHGGGDCEDLSLLFSASVRYLMNRYHLYDFNAWVPGNGKYAIYSTSDTTYYMPNADEKHFSAKYVYVTCFEKGSNGFYAGHCITSFCKEKVKNYMDLYNCTNIEPQEYGKFTSIGPIWLYISSDDLCMPVDNNSKCLTDFKQSIERILG